MKLPGPGTEAERCMPPPKRVARSTSDSMACHMTPCKSSNPAKRTKPGPIATTVKAGTRPFASADVVYGILPSAGLEGEVHQLGCHA